MKLLENIDTMLLGRKTYDLFAGFWPDVTTDDEIIADQLNRLNKVVFSKSLQKAPWGKFPEATILSTDAVTAVQHLKQQQGQDLVLWGSL